MTSRRGICVDMWNMKPPAMSLLDAIYESYYRGVGILEYFWGQNYTV